MSTRWIIPLCLAVFCLLAATLWIYLDQTRFSREQSLVLADLDDLRSATRARMEASAPQPLSLAPAPDPHVVPQMTPRSSIFDKLPALAESLDEKSVDLRACLNGAALIRNSQAMRDLRADRPVAALHGFDQILAESPDNTAALSGRAAALVALKRHDEAVQTYKRLISRSPDDAEARYNLGVLYCRKARYGDAATQFHEVVMLNPEHARAWFNLASLAQRDGKLAEAHQAWKRFTTLDPDNPTGWYQLGTVEMDLDAYQSAVFCFTYAVALTPEDVGPYINLALAYAALGDAEQAFSTAADADHHFPCNVSVHDLIAELSEVFPHAIPTSAPDPS
jgi:tetratricopeptide (TPR) repeat protein